ncbi:MAG: hypothetical protein JSS40_00915 [Proteobacteria bacterium]|nr:hypothetical protein [Pseudomonadota bacterium]
MGTVEEAKKLLALLTGDDPTHALADLTNWTATMNATGSFTPGRRGRILLLMHEAARPLWRALGEQYLAPSGRPAEGVDGSRAILQAMWDSASEFSDGFALVLDADGRRSKWVAQNLAILSVCSLRWLGRRLALAYMLQSSLTAAIWERLHRRYALAEGGDAARTAVPAYEGSRYNTNARVEYARALLLELANPDAVGPRDVELVYRIAARVASAVSLETTPSDEANFAVLPKGDSRPTLRRLLEGKGASLLYIGTANCLPRLRAGLERDLGREPGEEDTLFGSGYTIRERNRMLERVIGHWGMDPPRRRVKRIGMAATARILAGYGSVLTVLPAPERSPDGASEAARRRLQLKLDGTSKRLKRSQLRAAEVGPARIVDASAGGLGLAIRRADARWAAHGELVAVLIEPGRDWFLGVLRRIFSIDEELRLGIQVLAAKPCTVTLRLDVTAGNQVWDEATRRESDFGERYKRGILPEPQGLPLAAGIMLLPPRLASKGTRFNVPLPVGEQRILVTRILDDTAHYQRVMFEPVSAWH